MPPTREWRKCDTFQAGQHGDLSQKLLTELSSARVTLLNPARRDAYDKQLRTADGSADSRAQSPLLRRCRFKRSQPLPCVNRHLISPLRTFLFLAAEVQDRRGVQLANKAGWDRCWQSGARPR